MTIAVPSRKLNPRELDSANARTNLLTYIGLDLIDHDRVHVDTNTGESRASADTPKGHIDSYLRT